MKFLKDKKALSKNSAGQVLEYRISLRTKIVATDFLTNLEILNYNSNTSVGYIVQEQYSDTLKFENNSLDNLIDGIYKEILIQLTDSIKTK